MTITKSSVLPVALGLLWLCIGGTAHGQSFLDKVRDAANAAKDKATQAVKPAAPTAPAAPPPAAAPANAGAAPGAPAPAATVDSINLYQNYDFAPGDTILFADDFTATQDGEFPDQWELVAGQGVVNRQAGRVAFLLTDGNYAKAAPRVRTKSYLGAQYTIEYDVFKGIHGGYDLTVFLLNGTDDATFHVGESSADYSGGGKSLSGSVPAAIQGPAYFGRWHHVAVAVRNNQLKAYIDQYRVLTVPDMHFAATNLSFGGIASQEAPLTFTNVRIASGGGMNLVGRKFTDAKIITHGINFDIDAATLRPESMGTLNGIKRVLTDNPDLRFEIDGHTDNTGTSAHNLALSQQRADAVKTQLIDMGIDAARLTTKGYGDAKPMASNDTPDGRANNRRVEFVRTSP